MAHPYDFYVASCRSIPTLYLVSTQRDERSKIREASPMTRLFEKEKGARLVF